MFIQRLIVSIIAAALVAIAIAFSFHPFFSAFFALLVAAVAAMALREYYHMAQQRQWRPLSLLGIAMGVAYILAVFIAAPSQGASLWGGYIKIFVQPLSIAWMAFFLIFAYYFLRGSSPVINSAITLFGLLYVVLPLSYLISINYFFPESSGQDGRLWLIYLLVVTKSSDVAAYFVGKSIGHTPLCPYISPKKSWEGAVAGFLAALGASELFAWGASHSLSFQGLFQLGGAQALWLGAVLGLTAQFGDLAESLLKRDSGVKDSSRLPGLGGVLDIVDSLLFTAPVLYILLTSGVIGEKIA